MRAEGRAIVDIIGTARGHGSVNVKAKVHRCIGVGTSVVRILCYFRSVLEMGSAQTIGTRDCLCV